VFYFKLILVTLWALISCSLWFIRALFSWRDPRLFSPSVNFLSWGGLKILGYKTSLKGKEYLHTLPAVLVVNHQSALDTLLLGSIWPPKVVPIGRKEIANVPIIGWWFVACGATLINRSSPEEARRTLDKQIALLKNGFAIGMTPEGTRNKLGKGLLPFKKGAFHLAIQAQVPIVPIVIAPLGEIANWKNKTLKKALIPIETLEPIPTVGLTEKDVDSLIEKVHSLMAKKLQELEGKIISEK
jgi:lysophosphatidate acyltransferase